MKNRILYPILLLITVLTCTVFGADDIDLQSFKARIISDFDVTDPLDLTQERAAALYHIDPADIAESASFITMDGTFPDEVILLRAADANAADRIETQLELRLEEIMNQSQNYDAENYALLKKCKIQKKGTIVAIFISAKGVEMQNAFEDATK